MATKKRSYRNNSLKKRTYRKKSYKKKSYKKNKKSKRNKKRRRMKGGSSRELTEMEKLKLKYLEEQDRVKEINLKIQQKLNTITILNEMGVTQHDEFLKGEIEELKIEIHAEETQNKTKISDLKNLLKIHKWQSRQLLKACDYDYNKAIHLGLTFMVHGSDATQENLDNIKREYDPKTEEGMKTIKNSVQRKGVALKRQKAEEEEKKEEEAARAKGQLFESIQEILGNYMEDIEIRKFIETNKDLQEELIREQAITESNIREFLYRVSGLKEVDEEGRSLAQYYLSKSDSLDDAVQNAHIAKTSANMPDNPVVGTQGSQQYDIGGTPAW